MNKLILKSATQDKIIYLYQPEGKGTFGEISIKTGDDEATVNLKSDADETGYYARKACSKIKEFIEKKNLSMNYTQAWY